jgi:dipeptidyl-peptidase 4
MPRLPLVPLLLAVLPALAQQRQFGLEAFATAPAAPPAVTWAPGGKRFAYVHTRSVWLYDIPSASRRELVSLTTLEEKAVQPPATEAFDWQNRRVQEQTFQWSSSGRELLVVAGGDLFYYHLDGGAVDQLTATVERERDPKLSPDARFVSFRREHDLYCLDIAAKQVTRLTRSGSATLLNGELDWVYPEELDLTTAHWWAPDSSRIAFLQFDVSHEPVFPQVHMMQPKAVYEPELFPQPGTPNADVRLGVVTTAGELKWMDLGEPRGRLLARVYWSPDSRSVAALRLNRVQNEIDLMLADSRTGAAHAVVHEQDPAWVNVNDDFHFLPPGDRFLWGSERDGFRHLYLYSIEGKRLAQITKGDWEVTRLAGVDEVAKQIFYLSTETSPLERHLYRIGFDGKHKQRLTSANGTHNISMSPACDYYLDTFSTAAQTPESTIHDRSGERVTVYAEAPKPPEWLLRTEIVDFKSADGEKFYAHLIRPPGFTAGKKYPVIVMIYGGPHAQQVTDGWHANYLDQYLAHRGFVIWQMDNRGTAGRGHKWETRIHRNLGAQELKDQLEGLRHLETLGVADMTRVGMYGWSYGGFMTLYALTNAPDTFRAGAAGAPVTDWRNYDSIYTERYMGLPDENAEGYRRSSPVGTAAALKAKLLLLHNVQDDNVHFANTMQMAAALEAAGKRFGMALYPQRTHGVVGPLRLHLWRTLTDFFEAELK